MIIKVKHIYDYIDQWAPFAQAEEWDNSGLLIGDETQIVESALITLDADIGAISLARQKKCSLIISHHPLLFNPIRTVIQSHPAQKAVREIIRSNISLISAHTNLDSAPGGVADSLAKEICGALGIDEAGYASLSCYGRHIRLSPRRSFKSIIRSIEPIAGLKWRINLPEDAFYQNIAIFPGSFPEDELDCLLANGIDLVICGEIKYHAAIMLADMDIAVLEIGHGISEKPVLSPLAKRLAEKFPACRFAVHEPIDYNRTAY